MYLWTEKVLSPVSPHSPSNYRPIYVPRLCWTCWKNWQNQILRLMWSLGERQETVTVYLNFCLQETAKLQMFSYLCSLWTRGLVPLKSMVMADAQHLWQPGHVLMWDLFIIQKLLFLLFLSLPYKLTFFTICLCTDVCSSMGRKRLEPLPTKTA